MRDSASAMLRGGRARDLTWRCFATVDTVDADLLALMESAGCVQVCYGFESADEAVLRESARRRPSLRAMMRCDGAKAAGHRGERHVHRRPRRRHAGESIQRASTSPRKTISTTCRSTSPCRCRPPASASDRSVPAAMRGRRRSAGSARTPARPQRSAEDDLPLYARRFYRDFYFARRTLPAA